jgi:hypothetical protein
MTQPVTPPTPVRARSRGLLTGGWPMTAQDLAAIAAAGHGGPVGVQHQGPAPAVNHHLVVEGAQQHAVGQAGRPAVSQVPDVVDLAGGRGLGAAAGPAAAPVPQHDRVADAGRDGLAVADIQRQAWPGQPGPELLLAQETGRSARTGQQVGGLADDGLAQALLGRRGGRLRRLAGRILAGVVAGGSRAGAVLEPGLCRPIISAIWPRIPREPKVWLDWMSSTRSFGFP